uniref:Uncharacterized protein n=1 Tax=Caenorhabditis japonica TaxID=281687 RepID=A0A8R1EPW6_CAEJA
KALQLWALVVRDSALPYAVRKDMMHRATWAAYAIASVKEFAVVLFAVDDAGVRRRFAMSVCSGFWSNVDCAGAMLPVSG